jgi:hypothetical protein
MAKRSVQERADLRAQAVGALKQGASAASQATIDRSFDGLCVELLSEWILAEPRPESQTQQVEYWMGRVYDDLIVDEQPEPTRIYARFALSLPRAQYVTRLLRARMASTWRTAVRDELRTCLERVESKANQAAQAVPSQGATQRFECSVSRGAYDELLVLYDAAAATATSGERPAPPRAMPSSPNIAWFSLSAETVLLLLATIRNGDRR